MKRPTWLLVATTLLFFWLALDSMVGDSPTMDEQNHLARGLAFVRTGDPRLSVEHPPLINTISALPLFTLPDVSLPTDHPSWSRPQGWYEFADLLLWHYNDDATLMIFLARLPIVFLTLALALTGLRFAKRLWGPPAGTFAFLFLLFDPNILAHGRYATTDLGGALFVFLAAFLLWRHWQSSSSNASHFLWAGLGLGLAYSSKLSSLVFGPIFAVLAILPLYGRSWSWQQARNRLLQFAGMNLIAVLVVWTVFAFQFGTLQLSNPRLSFLNGLAAPMPTFWAGVEQIVLLSEGGRPSFLLGETSITGFAAYFPVAFLVKTPLVTLILLILVVFFLIIATRNLKNKRCIVILLLPATLYFLVSMLSDLNIGYRHLLPVLPFLYVTIAGGIGRFLQRWRTRPYQERRFVALGAHAVALLFIVSSAFVHPHYLSYFNMLAGGPTNGYRILVDSNVDWGQDLLRLKDWMEENDVPRIHLSWFGTADPAYYDISYDPLPGLPRHFELWWAAPFDVDNPEPGVYAISVSNLWELPLQDEKTTFSWFRARPPTDRVAYSILIYEVK